MLKSILLVFSGGLLIAAPMAIAGHGPQQAAQVQAAKPAQAASPAPAVTPAPTQVPAQAVTPQAPAQPPAAVPAGSVADDMKNPVIKPTAESQAKAKQIYTIDCAMCHGDNGNGKTDLATSMSLTLADFTDQKSLADRMDGELFNLIRNGKDKMPGEDKARATDTEVWNLVIYVRNLSKAQSAVTAAQ